MNLPVVIKFVGDRAEQHVLPAFDAAESLDGLAKSLLIPINYLFERKVRHKNFKYEGYNIDLIALKPGSVDALFQIQLSTDELAVLRDIAVGVGSSLIYDFLKAFYARAIGKNAPESIEHLESDGHLNTGDMGAIQDAALPSIRRAHTVINRGANNIFVFADQHSTVRFDSNSKQYVQDSIDNRERRTKLVSVASYNANTRYGRVFDFQMGKTIPFNLTNEIDAKTIATITGSISDYALARRGNELDSAVAILYTSVDSVDGNIKKLMIHKARKELVDLSE